MDLLERVSRVEGIQTAILEEERRTGQKLDTLLELSIKIASTQGDVKNLAEKIDKLFQSDSDKEDRLKHVESKVNKGIGMLGIIVILVLPVAGWVISNAYQQISAIDRRLLGVEYQIQKPNIK
jgi:hypothetical protein